MFETTFVFSLSSAGGDTRKLWEGTAECVSVMPGVVEAVIERVDRPVTDLRIRISTADRAAARRLHNKIVKALQERDSIRLTGMSYDLRKMSGRSS